MKQQILQSRAIGIMSCPLRPIATICWSKKISAIKHEQTLSLARRLMGFEVASDNRMGSQQPGKKTALRCAMRGLSWFCSQQSGWLYSQVA